MRLGSRQLLVAPRLPLASPGTETVGLRQRPLTAASPATVPPVAFAPAASSADAPFVPPLQFRPPYTAAPETAVTAAERAALAPPTRWPRILPLAQRARRVPAMYLLLMLAAVVVVVMGVALPFVGGFGGAAPPVCSQLLDTRERKSCERQHASVGEARAKLLKQGLKRTREEEKRRLKAREEELKETAKLQQAEARLLKEEAKLQAKAAPQPAANAAKHNVHLHVPAN